MMWTNELDRLGYETLSDTVTSTTTATLANNNPVLDKSGSILDTIVCLLCARTRRENETLGLRWRQSIV